MNKQEILEAYRNAVNKDENTISGIAFKNLTGINETEWTRFWPKIRDLQRDAGFEPLEFGSKLYTDTEVIEAWIGVIRYYGHFPARGELLVYKNTCKVGPSERVLRQKFGQTKDTLSKIIKYCQSNGSNPDIVTICEAKLQMLPCNPIESNELDRSKNGWVYLIKVSPSKYKIGHTDNLDRRLDEHSRYLPDSKYTHTIETDDPSGVEAYWHRRFHDKLVQKSKETFNLTSDDIAAFKRWRRIV